MNDENKPHLYTLYNRLTSDLKSDKLKLKGCKKISHENRKKYWGSNTFIKQNRL